MRNFFVRFWCITLFSFVLVGCGTVPAMDLSKSDGCCKSLSSISYRQITFNEAFTMTLRSAEPMVKLNEQVVSVIPLMLPVDSSERIIIFRSYINGFWMPTATVMQPEFHFLNENKEFLISIKEMPLYQLWREPVEPKRILTDGYFGAINIPKNSVYLLIASNYAANPLSYYRGAGAGADSYLREISRQSELIPLQKFIDGTALMPKFDSKLWHEYRMKSSMEGDLTIKIVAK
jgi:hypothetical protein